MIRHLFKLVWNRRRANGLILVELLCSFLALCGLLAAVVHNLDHWRRPLGFSYDNVWFVSVETEPYYALGEEQRRAIHERMTQLELELQQLLEIAEMSAYGRNVPFVRSTSAYLNYVRGTAETIETTPVNPELKSVLDLQLISGRWLEPGDGDLNWSPVVISRNYAELLFGDEDPIGRIVTVYQKDGTIGEMEEGQKQRRVVGVIADFRRRGECVTAPYSEFQAHPATVENLDAVTPPAGYMLALRPGTTAAFEEKLLQLGHNIAGEWSFEVVVLEDARRDLLRDRWLPLLGSGVVAAFLIIMVGMGLVGVLWQSVTRRTRELGLRRALGATAAAVRRQVLGELLALTTLAVGAGSLLFIQIPILQVFGQVGFHIYLIALAVSMLVIYPFVILCGLYPSWLATRVHPVQALQYE